MASLKLLTEKRNSLFFGKYLYRAKCKVHGAVYTYYTKNLDEFKQKMTDRANSRPRTSVEIMSIDWQRRIDLIDYEQIGRYFDWRYDAPKDNYMARISGHTISFFSDDLTLLKSLVVIDPDVRITKAELLENNVIYFKKDPQFKFRTFFRGKRVPDGFKEELQSFIDRYDDTARICPALKRLINETVGRRHWYNYLHSSYYVDYNDESTLTLLHMFFGSMLAKTYSLQKEPLDR
jgi:hypothetical protein